MQNTSWIVQQLPWIVSIAVAAGSLFVYVQVCDAKINKVECEFSRHSIEQKAIDQLPVRLEYMSQQLQEIKLDIKEIKAKVK